MPDYLPDCRQHCRMADTREASRRQRTVQCASMLAFMVSMPFGNDKQ